MITSGSIPKGLKMKNCNSQDCDDHHSYFAPKVHPEGGKKVDKHLAEHQRGAGHPAKHSAGKMPSQLAPDHGPHR